MSTQAQVQAIRAKQLEIENALKAVQQKLEQAERMPAGPAITLMDGRLPSREVTRVMSVQEALRQRQQELQALLKELRRQQAAARQADAERKASQAQGDFLHKARGELDKASQQGYLEDAEVRDLINKGEQALNTLLKVLRDYPTAKNTAAALEGVSKLIQIGWEGTGPDNAFRQLLEATQRMHKQADQAFRRIPSGPNLQQLLKMRELVQRFGGTTNDRPEGWRPVNKSHKTLPGDTFSGLSQRYYGSPKYWDVIYLENLGVPNPDRLPPGLPLRIP